MPESENTIPGVTDDRQDSRSGALTAAAALFFLVGIVVLVWNVPLPLIAYSPGPTSDAIDAVVVEGADVHPPEGELMMLTVAGQDINAFEAVVAAVDPAVDVLARQAVRRPDESDEEYRRRNLELMDQSTQLAISVALARLELAPEELDTFITGYAADTPAGQVLEIGDRIISLDGHPIDSAEDLPEALEDDQPGQVVSIVVERAGEERRFSVELQEFEDDPERPFIGIFIRELPFWIDIQPGVVGGPSAGMMYTLAIVDLLSEGDLTKGHVVAGTGTVDRDGNVGSIGGIRQKVVAAEAAGAEFLLVPEGNYEQARTAPRTYLELVPVATIDEALEFLRTLTLT